MSNMTHGPTRALVEQLLTPRFRHVEYFGKDDEIEAVRAAADALDARRWPQPTDEAAVDQLWEALYEYVVVEDEDDLGRIAAAVLRKLAAFEPGNPRPFRVSAMQNSLWQGPRPEGTRVEEAP